MPNYFRPLLVCAAVSIACSDSTHSSAPLLPPAPGIISIVIEPAGIAMAIGDTLRFHATASLAAITGFTWASDHPEILSIDASGLGRALKAGIAAIQACGNNQAWVCGTAPLTVH